MVSIGTERPHRETGQSIDAPGMDLLPIFRNAAEVGSPPLYYPGDRHWTEAGHGLAARSIMRFLVSEGLAR